MKKIGLISVLAGIFLAGSMAWSNLTHADQPLDCAPEDREVPGNTNSDCKWDYRLDDITGVRFVVLEREGSDACFGALEFYPYDFAHMTEAQYLQLQFTWTNIQTGGPISEFGRSYTVRSEGNDSILRAVGVSFDLKSPFPEKWEIGQLNTITLPNKPWQLVRARVIGKGANHNSSWFPIPSEVNDFPVMLNACLAEVKLRLESTTQIEEDRAKIAAQELARQQALNEEKAKAALDAQRLAAAQKALQIQQEIELTKTRSLIARLERDKIILGVWNDIVLERLRGFRERAEITNRYLAEVEANAAAFSAKVREKYEELQRLEALNQAIADAIAAHNEEIEAQLVAAAELEAKNMKKLDDLSVTPPTPALTPGG